jgi:hypothetical protein
MIWIHRLVTESGFIEAFWERLRERRRKDPSVSQEAVFEELNEEYREVFGEDRFTSFDAFRKRRDRGNPK